ncbi:MAG: hypothetical protein P4M08_06040 [Oligoflexia bacterium]|nr:hypothetical protein [Oligoflexia bacterium]
MISKRKFEYAVLAALIGSGAMTGCAHRAALGARAIASAGLEYVHCNASSTGTLKLTPEDNTSLLSDFSPDVYFAPVLTSGHLRLIDLRTMKEAENYDVSELTKRAPNDENDQEFTYSDLSFSPSGSYILVSSSRLGEDRQVLVDRANKKVTLLATTDNAWLEQSDTLVQDIASKSITLMDAATLAPTVYDTPGRPGGRLLNYPPATLRDNLVIIQDTPKPRAIIYSLEKKEVSQRYEFTQRGSITSLVPYRYAILSQPLARAKGKNTGGSALSLIRLSDLKTIATVKSGPSSQVTSVEVGTEVILYSFPSGPTKRAATGLTTTQVDTETWKVTSEHYDGVDWKFTPIDQDHYLAGKIDVTGANPPIYTLRATAGQALFTETSRPRAPQTAPNMELISQSTWIRINGPSNDQIGLLDSQNPNKVYYYNIPGIGESAGNDSAWFTTAGFLVNSEQALSVYTLQTQDCSADSFHF